MGAPFVCRQQTASVRQNTGGSAAGAGEGNRTLVVSLEGFCSTIELHPHFLAKPHRPCRPHRSPPAPSPLTACFQPLPGCPGNESGCESAINEWWRGKDSNLRRHGRQIYSLLPLTAREPLRTKLAILARKPLTVKRFTAPPRSFRSPPARHAATPPHRPRCGRDGLPPRTPARAGWRPRRSPAAAG